MYTYETVTVDKAISRGQKMVNLPVMLVMFGFVGLGFLLGAWNILAGWGIAIFAVVGFIMMWVCWGVMITKWRIWAFENVRNVHELKRKAIEGKLIWPDGSFWEKTEIRTQNDKMRLELLQAKFELEDVYSEDLTIAPETSIYYSKSAIYGGMVISVLCLGLGIFFLITKNYIGGAFASAFGLYFIYSQLKKALNKDPQIILSDKGIETAKIPFYEWKDIESEEVVTRNSGKTTNSYLKYIYAGTEASININDLDIKKPDLENLLHTYRLRSEKRKAREQTV